MLMGSSGTRQLVLPLWAVLVSPWIGHHPSPKRGPWIAWAFWRNRKMGDHHWRCLPPSSLPTPPSPEERSSYASTELRRMGRNPVFSWNLSSARKQIFLIDSKPQH